MKEPFKLLIVALFILNIIPELSKAQGISGNTLKKDTFKRIDSIIHRTFRQDLLKDSAALYAINFEIEIIKKGKCTKVLQIKANDSLAYELFPSFKDFYSFDYNVFMGSMRRIVLVIPVLIANTSSEKQYKKDNGSALIDIQSAINVAYSLTSIIPYNNIKEAESPLEQRIYGHRKSNIAGRFIRNTIILNPYFIEIVNIP